MKFTIKIKKVSPGLTSLGPDIAELTLDIEGKILKRVNPGLTSFGLEILSDRTLSENLLPAIDELLKKAQLKNMPRFEVECDDDASVISCNIARVTASALNLE